MQIFFKKTKTKPNTLHSYKSFLPCPALKESTHRDHTQNICKNVNCARKYLTKLGLFLKKIALSPNL